MIIRSIIDEPSISTIQKCYIAAGIAAFCIFVATVIVTIVKLIKTRKMPRAAVIVTAVISLLIYLTGNALFSLSNTGEFGAILDPDTGFSHFLFIKTFDNAMGRDVVYDAKGNEYTYGRYKKGFMYYDAEGKEYRLTTINDDEEMQQMVCIDTNEVYTIENRIMDETFYIDEDGYISLQDRTDIDEMVSNDIGEYYIGTDGKKYYPWYIINWDKDGNMYYHDEPISVMK